MRGDCDVHGCGLDAKKLGYRCAVGGEKQAWG